jgi:hypothetical protein
MSRFLNVLVSAGLVCTLYHPTGANAEDTVARVEFSLKTPRPRDPVLGGPRDKVSVSVWIPDGVKTVRGAMCNPFSKGDNVSAHWQAVCRHWKFAYVQVDFDAVKKDEFVLLTKGLEDLAKKTGHPELAITASPRREFTTRSQRSTTLRVAHNAERCATSFSGVST